MPRSRTLAVAAVGAVVALVVTAVAVLWPENDQPSETSPTNTTVPSASGEPSPTSTAPVPSEATTPTTSPTPNSPAGVGGVVTTPDESFLIANLAQDIEGFSEPDGEPTGTVPASWHDRPSQLPVIDQEPGWLHVRLPQRPNGSTAWIRRTDVDLTSTSYRIEIDVATMRLKLYDAGEVALDAPAGIGTDEAPTTVGNFFVTFLQEPPDTTSGWGPFVMVTSSHSETISDFQSSGDAIAAIHGPLGAADEIGRAGAKVSHGCVRLHLDDLDLLRAVPPGSPVDVIDSSSGA
jgi:lipoprotein-anchoring transpeptidase ErfK/SrfK